VHHLVQHDREHSGQRPDRKRYDEFAEVGQAGSRLFG
jgi:hypothetical protein